MDLDIKRCNALKHWAEETLLPSYVINAFSPDPKTTADADIIVTSTTSNRPVFQGANIKSGVHLNAIGAFTPNMQEIDEETVLRADKIVVDAVEETWNCSGDMELFRRPGRSPSKRPDI